MYVSRVISKKALYELEQMLNEKGYFHFSIQDATKNMFNEGRLTEILGEFMEHSPPEDHLPTVESVSEWNSKKGEFITSSFVIDISTAFGPNIIEMGIQKSRVDLTVSKTFIVKTPDDIRSKQQAEKEANNLFKHAEKLNQRARRLGL